MSTSRRNRHPAAGALGAVALALLLALPAGAQAAGAEPGWAPWLGCWEQEGAESGAASLCVRPTGTELEVELLTVEEGEIVDRRIVRADGERTETAREGCSGWERAEFSGDGRRIHLRSELECEGGVQRRASGILAFVSATEWVDVRSVGVEERRSAGVRRYRPAGDRPEGLDLEAVEDRRLSIETARMSAGSPPDLRAVVEASERVHPETVSAWLVEQDRRFRLDGERLVRLADAGVPDEVIDVVVAVSHPERFSVGGAGEVAQREATGRTRSDARRSYGSGTWYGNPFRYRPYRFHPWYRSSWRFGFSPWSYSSFGWSYGRTGLGYRPIVVRVEERDESKGRVVNGRGYTRTDRSGSSTDAAGSRSSPSDRTGISGSDRRGRSSITPSKGYTGSSSSGSGRKAKPRGGSGGEESGGSGGGR